MKLFRGQVASDVNRRTLARVGIAAAAACLVVFSMSSPALADPQPDNPVEYPTAGWSGQWQFSGPHAWSLTMTMPGTVIAITGWDEDDSRYFSGTITDTTSVNRCSTIRFYEGGGMAYYTACDGTVSFSQFDNTPGTYDFELHQWGDYHQGHEPEPLECRFIPDRAVYQIPRRTAGGGHRSELELCLCEPGQLLDRASWWQRVRDGQWGQRQLSLHDGDDLRRRVHPD